MFEETTITVTKIYPPTRHIDPVPFFSQPDARQEKLFQHRMLSYPLRQRVIEIKNDLRQALIAGRSFPRLCLIFGMVIVTSWRIRKHVGKVAKENTVYKNDHILIDCLALVRECHHNAGREAMVNSAGEVGLATIAHDNYYKQIFYRMIYYIHQKIEAGEWVLELDPFPKELAHCWDDEHFKEALNGRP